MTNKEREAVAEVICSLFGIALAFTIGFLCAFGLN